MNGSIKAIPAKNRRTLLNPLAQIKNQALVKMVINPPKETISELLVVRIFMA
jgi:hypothetical protein